MSIKKVGQGGEYLYFSVKKKFYSLVFLVIKIVLRFCWFLYLKILKNQIEFILNYPFLLVFTNNYNITFFIL